MAKEIVVSLTSDEERLLRGFRRVEAAEKSVQGNFEQTGKVAENVGKRIADAMIKAGRDGTGSLNKHLAALRRDGGRDGRQLAEGLEKNFRELGLHGRRSIDEIAGAIARLDPEAGKMLAGMRQELEATKRTDLFAEKRQELKALGGDFEIMAQQIDSKINAPLKNAADSAGDLVKQMQELSPEHAEAISAALSEAQQVIEKTRFDDLVKELERGDIASREMAETIRSQLPGAFDETERSMDSVLQSIATMRPELASVIEETRSRVDALARETSFESQRQEIAKLGTEYKQLADEISKAMESTAEVKADEAARLLNAMSDIDPSKAEAVSRAMEATRAAVERTDLKELVSELSSGDAASRQMAEAIRGELVGSVFEAKSSMDDLLQTILQMRPELAGTISAVRDEVNKLNDATKFEEARQEIAALGGQYKTLGEEIERALSPSGDESTRVDDLVEQMKALDPSKAEAITKALTETQRVIAETNLRELVEQLDRGGEEGKGFAEIIRTELAGSIFEAERATDDLLSSIQAMRPELTGAIDEFRAKLEAANKETSFANIRSEIAALGGEYKVLASEIDKAMAPNLEERVAEAKRLVAELKEIDPQKAEALDRALANARKNVADTKLDKLMSQLSQASDDGQSLAKALGTGMQEASLQAEGGIDGIADRIIALRPEMKATIDQWRADMAEAARFGEGEYAKPLAKLREAGPIGKKVAEELKRELVAAGKIVERSFDDMLSPLDKLDPIAADQARKMKKHFDDIEMRGKSAFSNISSSAMRETAQIVLGYVGVQEAIEAVTEVIQDQRQVLKDASDAHMTLAQAQQEAVKNLATLPKQQRDELINETAYDIADKAGVPEIAQVVRALGNARSAGGDFEEVKSAVEVSAMANPLTPENIAKTSSSLIDLANATGVADARINMNQSLVAGAESRMEDPIKVARAMAPAAVAAANRAPGGMRDLAAYQAMSIVSAISKMAADAEGDTSSTGTVQFTQKLDEFTSGLQAELTSTQEKIATDQYSSPLSAQQKHSMNDLLSRREGKDANDQKIAALEKQLATMESEDAAADPRFRTREETAKRKKERAAIKAELSNAKSMAFDSGDEAKLADLEAKEAAAKKKFAEEQEKRKKRVAELESAGVKAGDNLLPFSQLELLHRAPGLKKEFLDIKFGEQRVRPGMESLIVGGEAMSNARDTYTKLNANRGRVDKYEEKLHEIRNATPQIRESILRRRGEANEVRSNSTNTFGASQSNVRESGIATLKSTRSDNYPVAVLQSISEPWMGGSTLRGSDSLEESVSLIQQYANRIAQLELDGVTDSERPKIEKLQGAVTVARQRLSSPEVLDLPAEKLEGLSNMAFDNMIAGMESGTSRESKTAEKILTDLVVLMKMQLEEAEKTRKLAEEQRDEQRKRDAAPNRSRPPSPSDAQREAARRSAERAGGAK
ncbi:hypothetical protein [Rhodopirellula sp. SWK7]|uniref:hypothetical protein n=1 Tax=Rhodopirellula sp. SWK7 TaxID=595460 RepID=UPI0002BEE4BA|nr:hypothetical protein [Rhodopirellula sp. SWK7]EMI47385.1 hypothetical protein RRSWK_00116 [Rhodopirellula sp. SWK7]